MPIFYFYIIRYNEKKLTSIRICGILILVAGIAQLVERQPSKLNVASSTLVSRSKKICVISSAGRAHDFNRVATGSSPV